MNKHISIIVLSFLIIIGEVVLSIFFIDFKKDLFICIVMVMLVFYPTGLYTCYRMIMEESRKGNILERIVLGVNDNIFFGVFVIPLILSPIFFFDYIRFFTTDYRKNKWNKENEKY